MAKGKDARVIVIFECTSCARNISNKESIVISKYITKKNRNNTPKFCPCCCKHTIQHEEDRVLPKAPKTKLFPNTQDELIIKVIFPLE